MVIEINNPEGTSIEITASDVTNVVEVSAVSETVVEVSSPNSISNIIEVESGPQGLPGPAGDPGEPGDPGPPGTTTWSGITDKPTTFTPDAHNHDTRYYTESEIDTALTGKVNTSDSRLTDARTPTAHSHPQSDVTGLTTTLGNKVDTTDSRLSDSRTPTAHSHAQSDVTGLTSALGNKVDTTDARLSDARTPTAHDHDSRYYTESEIDALLASAAAAAAIARNANNPYGVYVVPAGRWWAATRGATTSQAHALNAVLVAPFYVPFDLKIDIARIEVSSAAGTAGSIIRLGYYPMGSDGQPDATLLKDCGSADSTTTGVKDLNVAGAITLTKGVWYQALKAETAGCSLRATPLSGPMPMAPGFDPGVSQQTENMTRTIAATGFPATGTWGGMSNVSPAKVYLKVAA